MWKAPIRRSFFLRRMCRLIEAQRPAVKMKPAKEKNEIPPMYPRVCVHVSCMSNRYAGGAVADTGVGVRVKVGGF
jgi:hypothetical protein